METELVSTSSPHLGNDAGKLLHLHFHAAHRSQLLAKPRKEVRGLHDTVSKRDVPSSL